MPAKTKMKSNEFYCVTCRSRVLLEKSDIESVLLENVKRPNGVPAARGRCPQCNQKLL